MFTVAISEDQLQRFGGAVLFDSTTSHSNTPFLQNVEIYPAKEPLANRRNPLTDGR